MGSIVPNSSIGITVSETPNVNPNVNVVANPTAYPELDPNEVTRLENYVFTAYTLEEISQPNNTQEVNLLYTTEETNFLRDINGNIVIDENTTDPVIRKLNINLSADKRYSRDYNRVVDIEFTELFTAPAGPNTRDLIEENRVLRSELDRLVTENRSLLESNTQIPDGTLIRSLEQPSYYAIIDKGKRRWFAFNFDLWKTVIESKGFIDENDPRAVVDMSGEIILQIPEGNDYRVVDFVGTGITVVNTHPSNEYILGLVSDPNADIITSVNIDQLLDKQWRIRAWNINVGQTSTSKRIYEPEQSDILSDVVNKTIVFSSGPVSGVTNLLPRLGNFVPDSVYDPAVNAPRGVDLGLWYNGPADGILVVNSAGYPNFSLVVSYLIINNETLIINIDYGNQDTQDYIGTARFVCTVTT